MRNTNRIALITSLALAITAAPAPARAGGFTFPIVGARGSSIGGFAARADDTSAMYHNPAGLGMLGDYMVDISGTGVLSHTNYRRCTEALTDAQGNPIGCKVSNKDGSTLYEPNITTVPHGAYPAGFGILPYLGLTGRFGLKKWNFGLALYSPHNATGAFPDCERAEDGEPKDCSKAPNRFHAMLGTVNTIFISPSASVTPIPDLHIGVTVSAVRAALTSERSLWIGGDKSSLAAIWDGEGSIRLDTNAWTWAFSLGVIWHAGRTLAPDNRWLKGLRLGAAYSSQADINFKSDLSLFSKLLYNMVQENDGCRKGDASRWEVKCKNSVGFTFPMQFRFGFNWSITEEWGIGMDAIWQDYSVYEEIRVNFDEPLLLQGGIKVTETVEDKDSFDSWTVLGGLSYAPRWLPGLEIGLTMVYDQSPYPDRTYSLLSPDADKIGPSIGIHYQTKFGLQVSAGFIALFYSDRVVRNSEMRPKICKAGDQSCLSIAPDANFSMNGDVLNKRVDLFNLQVGWRFGEVKRGLPY